MPIRADDREFLQHLNGHMLCAVDVETTGLDPGYHEIFEIAVIPLDGQYKPNRHFTPLSLQIMPSHPDRIDWGGVQHCGNVTLLKEALEKGMTQTAALTIIERWFSGLNLLQKRIVPLMQNGTFDLPHLRHFLGELNYDSMFQTSELRDTMYVARFINDLADIKGWAYPFPKVDLKSMCTSLGIDPNKYGRRHTAWVDALLTAEVYPAVVEWLKLRTLI